MQRRIMEAKRIEMEKQLDPVRSDAAGVPE
jgi:hypothetical protein